MHTRASKLLLSRRLHAVQKLSPKHARCCQRQELQLVKWFYTIIPSCRLHACDAFTNHQQSRLHVAGTCSMEPSRLPDYITPESFMWAKSIHRHLTSTLGQMAQYDWGFRLRTDRNKAVVAVVTVRRKKRKDRCFLRLNGSHGCCIQGTLDLAIDCQWFSRTLLKATTHDWFVMLSKHFCIYFLLQKIFIYVFTIQTRKNQYIQERDRCRYFFTFKTEAVFPTYFFFKPTLSF